MLASDIIDRARIVLNDADGVRWLDSEMFKWINDGQRVIALVRPDSSVANYDLSLVAGTKQSLPANGMRLLDVVRNTSGGRVVRHVDRGVLDAQNPSWHGETPSTTIKNYVYDNRDPKNFYVYPPAAVGASLNIIYSKNPAEVTALNSTIDLSDVYSDPLLNYVLHRAYLKDAEHAHNLELSANYMTVFQVLLGIKTGKDAAFSPDLNSKGNTTMPNPVALQMGGV